MTNAELIAKLQQFPNDRVVKIHDLIEELILNIEDVEMEDDEVLIVVTE